MKPDVDILNIVNTLKGSYPKVNVWSCKYERTSIPEKYWNSEKHYGSFSSTIYKTGMIVEENNHLYKIIEIAPSNYSTERNVAILISLWRK